MPLFDPINKIANLKIIYYGPHLSGKATSIDEVYRHYSTISLIPGPFLGTVERTDFELGKILDFRCYFQLISAPGNIRYNSTRELILRSLDGLVFVADSQPKNFQKNIDSLQSLQEILNKQGHSLENIPLVFQWNKQDLTPLSSPSLLNESLNFFKAPTFKTTAFTNKGVLIAFEKCSELVRQKVTLDYQLSHYPYDSLSQQQLTNLNALKRKGANSKEIWAYLSNLPPP